MWRLDVPGGGILNSPILIGIKVMALTLLSIIVLFSLPWIFIYVGIQISPNPPIPEITYGEFPFRLEYELEGKRVVIEDILICEYDGIGSNEGMGKYRKWKGRLASGNEEIVLLKVDNNTEIIYKPGSASYYMDDLREYEGYDHLFPYALLKEYEEEHTNIEIVYQSSLLHEYHIKLIDWDYTQPIQNNFITK